MPIITKQDVTTRAGSAPGLEVSDLVDAAVLFGTGFAPFRGGPLTYARARGVPVVVARLTELAARYGERFQPDRGWPSIDSGAKP